jgi:hypothetical protein
LVQRVGHGGSIGALAGKVNHMVEYELRWKSGVVRHKTCTGKIIKYIYIIKLDVFYPRLTHSAPLLRYALTVKRALWSRIPTPIGCARWKTASKS